MKTFSIVIPVYQNETNIEHTVGECIKFISTIPDYRVEIIFVDDGSTDKSFEFLKSYQAIYSDIIRVIKLTKNSGQPAATLAGMNYASGRVIGVISADLQDPLELFSSMLKDWEAGKKLVIATRVKRSDGIVSDILSGLFYHLIDRYAIKNYPRGGVDFFIIDRVIVEQLTKVHEKHGHLVMLIFSFGYSYTVHPYERRPRLSGKSQYTFWKKIKVFYDAFMANSYAPIRFVSAIGTLSSLFGFTYGFYVVFSWFNNDQHIVNGWASIVVLLSFFSGLILVSLGILGEYIWRIYEDIRNRPRYIIDEVYDNRLNNNQVQG